MNPFRPQTLTSSREPSPTATAREERRENLQESEPLRVLFVHPTYPNTFTQAVEALASRPGLSCAYLVENCCQAAVKAHAPRVSCYGFEPEAIPQSNTYQRTASLGHWMSRGVGVARSLLAGAARYPFDVVVGSASNGCTLYLGSLLDSAIVSYCEHPSFALWQTRPEFPPNFDQHVFDIGYQAMILASLAHADLGMVASEHARSLFPPEFQAKVRVQSEGFALPPLTNPHQLPQLRRQCNLPESGPLIGFFGRSLEAVRGFDVFLEIAARLKQARPEIQILAIGSAKTIYGSESYHLGQTSFKEYALARTSLREEDIIWRDFLPHDKFFKYLACLDLAILPTFEGASNWSFFDAMAAAVPILAANRSYIPELIATGENGYLFDPTDIEAGVRLALYLLDRPEERQRIGNNAREHIRQHHTPERAAEGYEQIVREAAALRQLRRGSPPNGSSSIPRGGHP